MALPTIDDCDGCGVCCFHMGYPSFVYGLPDQQDEVHWTQLPSELKHELLEFVSRYSPPAPGELDGPCFWLDISSRRCRYHAHRPKVCRDFRVGSQGCLQWREYYRDQIKTG